ncbi:transcriptional regulator [Streptomyces lunaelactis]|uniref:Putative SARP-family transcriptional activator n=1 Tax=Streptomyces lunaelactis TaxID=1535768 RepID=A0A2H5BVB0_9ACTN|nr:AfsR/SARP family transcriptional regulator BagI/FevR [Streptomyces lunaelactis]AUG90778.1 putative SARP-family transcriptional activator [Streptomyces lunaelactis]AVZ74333.1 transcriptional regulator [Streptomyces lunaelactis]NUK85670.1 AfsR/SARP family transcriptional regulator [Streptomyces lunaelactis]NUL05294.1 AfsR/SARP family transcriptional regulator [Streptomyces lunaelactis]
MRNEHVFRILGPLLVTSGDEQIEISGIRRQKLLAALLLQTNQVVSLGRLVDAMWDDHPPASAHGQIRICVSGLRRLLRGPERDSVIETHPSCYRIRVRDDDALDLFTFEKLVTQGRAMVRDNQLERAEGLLKSALALWRGPVAAGLDSRALAPLVVRLNEDRLTVKEEHFDVTLKLGRHQQIIGDLTGFVAENPFRERALAQLMLALYHSGRQADALETFRTARMRFSEDLGIEPARDLHVLHQSILVGRLSSVASLPRDILAPPPPSSHGQQGRPSCVALLARTSPNPVTPDSLEQLRLENDLLRVERDGLRNILSSLWLNSNESNPGA